MTGEEMDALIEALPVEERFRFLGKLRKKEAERLLPTFRCADCLQHHGDFTVNDDVWAIVFGPGQGHLCLPCFEKRLGRSIEACDLRDVPVNDGLKLLFQRLAKPIPMLLWCPQCAFQHIDEPNPARDWDNPPHRSHECLRCGHVWRVADVATTGVASIETSGVRDGSPVPRFPKRRMKHKCPYCTRVRYRSFQAIQENPFCAKCLRERMKLAHVMPSIHCTTCKRPMVPANNVPDHYICRPCGNVVELTHEARNLPEVPA